MKPRLLVLTFAALLLALGALAAACGEGGGEGTLSLEEYFQRVDPIFEEATTRLDAAETEFDEAIQAASTPEEVIEVSADFINAQIAVAQEGIDAMEALDPPAEAEDAHREWLAAGTALLALARDFVDRLEGAEPESELVNLLAELESPEFTKAVDRGPGACRALQRVADANNVAVDLDCEEE